MSTNNENVQTVDNSDGQYYSMKASTTWNSKLTGPPGTSFEVTLWIDFSNCSRKELEGWAASERRIAWQRSVRALEFEQFHELVTSGKPIIVPAAKAGYKPELPKTVRQVSSELTTATNHMSLDEVAVLKAKLDAIYEATRLTEEEAAARNAAAEEEEEEEEKEEEKEEEEEESNVAEVA